MALPSISDTLRTITAAIEDKLNKPVYFMQGHWPEIAEVLQSMTESKTEGSKKYPLIALMRDIEETEYRTAGDMISDFDLLIYIITDTENTLQADDRETSSFKAILHPIYEELIRQIQTSHLFMQGRDFEVKRIDRYYLGRTKVESQLNDYIDAIEVRLSGIKIRKQIC